MAESITFPAQVVKVQTLADSGLRLTLDLPETEIVRVCMVGTVQTGWNCIAHNGAAV